MRIVLDTNVLVSALFTRGEPTVKRASNPGKILDAIIEGRLQIALEQRIIDEYTAVLHRPRLNIPSAEADFILSFLSQAAFWVDCYPVDFLQGQIIDPGDLPFAEAAICSGAEVLVTGNLKHFGFLHNFPVKVLLPQEFIKGYGHLL